MLARFDILGISSSRYLSTFFVRTRLCRPSIYSVFSALPDNLDTFYINVHTYLFAAQLEHRAEGSLDVLKVDQGISFGEMMLNDHVLLGSQQKVHRLHPCEVRSLLVLAFAELVLTPIHLYL